MKVYQKMMRNFQDSFLLRKTMKEMFEIGTVYSINIQEEYCFLKSVY